jgi:filamentous hemagglutinin
MIALLWPAEKRASRRVARGASRCGSEVKDDRLKALYAAQAAYAVSDGYQAATAAGTRDDAGVSLRIGVGASSASSETKTHDETAYGSRIHSNGDIAIAATGGDLNIIGSQVDGTNVALAAANNINLLSQEELHSSKSTNRNGSGEIGFSIGSQTGFYVTASAGRGKGTGNGVTHAETTIGASDTLTLVSGNDTTIKGAQLTGNQVIAAIGGNLRVESEQDTDDYASKGDGGS